MRRTAVEIGALAALLLGVGLALCQQPDIPAAFADKPSEAKNKPAKSRLEEMLEKALRDNPDLRLAVARVAEADAELNRVRLHVVQKVGAAYQAIEAQKAAVESAAAELAETKSTAGPRATPQETFRAAKQFRAAQQKLIDAKTKLAALEAELPYLLGQQDPTAAALDKSVAPQFLKGIQSHEYSASMRLSRLAFDQLGRPLTRAELAAGAFSKLPVQGPTAERIRAALDKPFSYAYDGKGQQRIGGVILALKDAFEKDNRGLVINVNNIDRIGGPDEPLAAPRFDQVPFGAALEWIEDSLPGSSVVIRDYGIVIVPKDQLPPGAPMLGDFWHGTKTADFSVALASNAPAVRFQARVMSVAADGAVILRGYHDNHVAVGDTLEVYRLTRGESQKSKYLGAIRVTATQHSGPGRDEIVAKPINKMAEPVQPGDFAGFKIKADDVEKKSPPAKGQSSNPLTRHVEGLVKEINSTGMVLVNLGSDHFLAKGNILDVYRLDAKDPKKSKYVGKITIIETKPQESVAKPVGKMASPVQAGDNVSGRIPRD